jgi:hypothetical protein
LVQEELTLDADPPLRISNIETIGSQISLTWPGGPGMRLQQSTNLTHPDWQDVSGQLGPRRSDPNPP